MTYSSRRLTLCLTCILASISGYQLGCAGPAEGETVEIAEGDNRGSSGGSDGTGSPEGGGGSSGDPLVDDGGVPMDPSPDAGVEPPPPGTIGIFVAAGMGGRTITSCDDGMNWIANDIVANENDDHSPWTDTGLAYGNGTFIHTTGWGTTGNLKVSEDGVDWERRDIAPIWSAGGIAYLGDGVFGMTNAASTYVSLDSGDTWNQEADPPIDNHLRESGGGGPSPGMLLTGGSDEVPAFTVDRGKTWSRADGCGASDFGGIGEVGGYAYGNGTMLIVSADGSTCRTSNGGASWQQGTVPEALLESKPAFAAGEFWIPNGNHAFRSGDGASWIRVSFAPGDIGINAMAASDRGTFVGIAREGDAFYRSTDGQSWTRVQGASGPRLHRVVFGHGNTSGLCPGSSSDESRD